MLGLPGWQKNQPTIKTIGSRGGEFDYFGAAIFKQVALFFQLSLKTEINRFYFSGDAVQSRTFGIGR